MARFTDYDRLLNRIMDAADDCNKLSGTDREQEAYAAGFTDCEAIVRIAPVFIPSAFDCDTTSTVEWHNVNDQLPNVDKTSGDFESTTVIVAILQGNMFRSDIRIYERAKARGKVVYRWKYPWDVISDEKIEWWAYIPSLPKRITEMSKGEQNDSAQTI